MYEENVIFEIERLARIFGSGDGANKTIIDCMDEKLTNCQDVRIDIYITFIMRHLSQKNRHHPVSLLDIKMGASPKYRSFNRLLRTSSGKKAILSKLNHIRHILALALDDDTEYTNNKLKGNLLFLPSPSYLNYLIIILTSDSTP